MLPVIVATWPLSAKVKVTPLSKFCAALNTILPAPLVTLLLFTVGSATLASIPIPLTVVVPGSIPFTEATGTVVLLTTAAVVVVVIGVSSIAKFVKRTS